MSYPYLEYSLDLLPPGQMAWPEVTSSAIGGGISASGISRSIDMSGGGFVTVEYMNIQLGNRNQSALRFWNRICAATKGGVRPIVVPLLTDFTAPVSQSALLRPTTLTPFSDGSTFSDSTVFSSSEPVSGAVTAPAAVGAATISASVIGGTANLEGGEWFSIAHPTKGERAYVLTDTPSGSVAVADLNNVFTFNIRPTLREALTGGEIVRWWRPRCVMGIDPSTPIRTVVERHFWSTPSIKFVEWFGAL